MLLFVFSLLKAQNANFKHTYGGNAYAAGNSLVKTPDGGYLCVGSSSATTTATTDVYIFKTDSLGNSLWTKFYGGINIDVANHITATPDGNYVVCGYTNTIGNGGYDIYLMKINGVGDTLWTKTFGGTDWDFGNEAYVSPSGSIYVVAQSFSFGENGSGLLIKTDADGNEIFTKHFGGALEEGFSSLTPAFGNTLALAGYTSSYGQGQKDAYIIITDTMGVKLDSLIYGGLRDEELNDINTTGGNGLVAGGYTRSFSTDSTQSIYVLRTDSLFDFIWQADFGGAVSNSLVPANNLSDYAVAGYATNVQNNQPSTGYIWIGTAQPDAWLPNFCYFKAFNAKPERVNDIIKVPGGWCAIGTSEAEAPGFNSAFLMRLKNDLTDCGASLVLNNPATTAAAVGIHIAPNPSTGNVRISFPANVKHLSVAVYNKLGQQVSNKNYSNAMLVEDDFSALPNGYYTLRFAADGNYSSTPLVIAR